MKKITVFDGTINGEKFDNVQAYNNRMNELLNAGATDIQASSSTSIRTVKDESEVEMSALEKELTDLILGEDDEDLTMYPYFDEGDPKYLDLLVTDNACINTEALNEANSLLDKCYLYIADQLYDDEIPVEEKKDYLADVREIIAEITNDNTNTTKALASIDRNRASAAAELRAAEAAYNTAKINYNNAVKECDLNQGILQASKPVIARMLEFYRTVEADALEAIAETNSKRVCKCTEDKYTCDTDSPEVKCNIREVSPQQLKDVSEWFGKLLEACGVKVS